MGTGVGRDGLVFTRYSPNPGIRPVRKAYGPQLSSRGPEPTPGSQVRVGPRCRAVTLSRWLSGEGTCLCFLGSFSCCSSPLPLSSGKATAASPCPLELSSLSITAKLSSSRTCSWMCNCIQGSRQQERVAVAGHSDRAALLWMGLSQQGPSGKVCWNLGDLCDRQWWPTASRGANLDSPGFLPPPGSNEPSPEKVSS